MSYTAEPKQQDTNIKVPLISKIAYGMGDVGCNFSWMFVGNFLMIFYTDVCGISMAAVSLLMLVSRFWDPTDVKERIPYDKITDQNAAGRSGQGLCRFAVQISL